MLKKRSPEASRNTRKKERARGLDWDNPNFKWSLVPSSPPPSGALLLSGTDSSLFLRPFLCLRLSAVCLTLSHLSHSLSVCLSVSLSVHPSVRPSFCSETHQHHSPIADVVLRHFKLAASVWECLQDEMPALTSCCWSHMTQQQEF